MSNFQLYHGDCLEILPTLPAGSVDAIIGDIPYGTTACSWDVVIPFEPMWECVEHVLKPRGVFVTTASQPFTSMLVMSKLDWFKYEWVWDKVNRYTQFLDVKRKPLKRHDNIVVFYKEQCKYYPQMTSGMPYTSTRPKVRSPKVYGKYIPTDLINDGYRYPHTILKIKGKTKDSQESHPTQKPVALYEYLIRTYTDAGDTVLDMTMGSGTTGVACAQTGRNFIGIEIDETYFKIAEKRINKARQQLIMDFGGKV